MSDHDPWAAMRAAGRTALFDQDAVDDPVIPAAVGELAAALSAAAAILAGPPTPGVLTEPYRRLAEAIQHAGHDPDKEVARLVGGSFVSAGELVEANPYHLAKIRIGRARRSEHLVAAPQAWREAGDAVTAALEALGYRR